MHPFVGTCGRTVTEASVWRPNDVTLNGEGQNRTGDTTIFSRVLYQLSYLADSGRW